MLPHISVINSIMILPIASSTGYLRILIQIPVNRRLRHVQLSGNLPHGPLHVEGSLGFQLVHDCHFLILLPYWLMAFLIMCSSIWSTGISSRTSTTSSSIGFKLNRSFTASSI